MNDFKTLQLLDKFQFIFVKMGIDYDIMRKILHIKLTMDERKVPTLFNQAANKKKQDKKIWLYQIFVDLYVIRTCANSFDRLWPKLSFPDEYRLCNDYFF